MWYSEEYGDNCEFIVPTLAHGERLSLHLDCLTKGQSRMNDKNMNHINHVAPFAYQILPFCKLVGISRTGLYALIKEGKIKAVKLGGRTLIPRDEAERIGRGEVR